ncbi:MAG: Cytochrome b-c1 complex subunit 7 [Phylliscum demangeonii]|nr:MAG: Cytochrome b-c1 complex subunit 7 [Phylliscum demangeonii]
MSQPSLALFIWKRPWLRRMIMPIAEWYANAAGYRQLGLKSVHLSMADDLIPEESELVQKALQRLPPKEAYDRVFRMRRAMQCSLSHHLLPKEQWTKPEEDVAYLLPIIKELEAGARERDDLESMSVKPKK